MSQPSFNPYAAGQKRYGAAGLSAPTMGQPDMGGYNERDAKLNARRQAILNRIMQGQQGQVIGQPDRRMM